MPYVNVKYVKQQVNQQQKDSLVKGLMDILVDIMGRDPNFTVITVDEIDESNWFIGGKSSDTFSHEKLSYIEIRISKGTSSPEQMTEVIEAGKELVKNTLGSCDKTNYFIISELNPESWGFDGISMTIRNNLEK
jgi:4-oxalocrotonate tautomerase